MASTLLDIPVELRCLIYDYFPHDIVIATNGPLHQVITPILSICQQIRNEFLDLRKHDLFNTSQLIRLETHNLNFTRPIKFLKHLLDVEPNAMGHLMVFTLYLDDSSELNTRSFSRWVRFISDRDVTFTYRPRWAEMQAEAHSLLHHLVRGLRDSTLKDTSCRRMTAALSRCDVRPITLPSSCYLRNL